ncbi:MAG: nucleoside deaminase [Candidatus Altiarchaeales archaeon ex4484_2]|nr:MAG: nucleoside deaminase [Candidatus Altiarchaeales archaeon ex4484_2]
MKCHRLEKVIVNATILRGEELELIEEGFLRIEDGLIKEVGEGYERSELDYKEYVLIPALMNSHTHLGDSFAKEAVSGLDVREAVGPEGRKWQLYGGECEESIVDGMGESIEYMQELGTTFFADFREGGKIGIDRLRKACEGSRIKKRILGRDVDINYVDGLGLNVYNLNQIPEDRGNKLVAIHAGEEEGEVSLALEHDPDIIVHATLATREEIKDIAEREIDVVVCPRSNAALGVGFPPIRELIDAGVRVSLGTDNVMINSPNLFREMEFLYKSSHLFGSLSPIEVLQTSTVNPAGTFNLNSGFIDEGRDADLVFIDKDSVNMRHSRDILTSIVSRCGSADVKKVMVEGEMVVNKDER